MASILNLSGRKRHQVAFRFKHFLVPPVPPGSCVPKISVIHSILRLTLLLTPACREMTYMIGGEGGRLGWFQIS